MIPSRARLLLSMTSNYVISSNLNSTYHIYYLSLSAITITQQPSLRYFGSFRTYGTRSYRPSSYPRLCHNTKHHTNRVINRFRPTLAIWGITAGLGVSLYLSEVPLFQKDVLRKIPFVSLKSFSGTKLNEVLFLLATLPISFYRHPPCRL